MWIALLDQTIVHIIYKLKFKWYRLIYEMEWYGFKQSDKKSESLIEI